MTRYSEVEMEKWPPSSLVEEEGEDGNIFHDEAIKDSDEQVGLSNPAITRSSTESASIGWIPLCLSSKWRYICFFWTLSLFATAVFVHVVDLSNVHRCQWLRLLRLLGPITKLKTNLQSVQLRRLQSIRPFIVEIVVKAKMHASII